MNEVVQTRLWLAQRISAVVLAVCVGIHLAGIIIAVQGGLSAAEIIGRVGGSGVLAAFYGVFVLACAVHAPIGLRAVLAEMTDIKPVSINGIASAFAAVILLMGMQAVLGFLGLGGG
ncbi:MAG: succinate dehydrogenase [Proteobacteria bacterium]|nr:succinate dehydrogenase [Pseudomonadota bacterium]